MLGSCDWISALIHGTTTGTYLKKKKKKRNKQFRCTNHKVSLKYVVDFDVYLGVTLDLLYTITSPGSLLTQNQ